MFRTCLVAMLACLTAGPASADVALPGGRRLERVDFERHVAGVLGKAGCNAAACHGSFQGKGGFRLSLFSSDPGKDFRAVARDGGGRRVDAESPDESLLLLKPTGQVRHGGGVRFGKDSWEYGVLRDWVARGARREDGSGRVTRLLVTPAELAFGKAKEERTVKVTARFADGKEEDVTPFCDFRSNDDAVADVTGAGLVKGVAPGSTSIVVSYREYVRAVPALVPGELPPGFTYPAVPERNYLDRLVFVRLRRLNVVPSELCTDGEFLRRVTIDTIGRLPPPSEVRAFAADTDPDKRAKKIDELLAHPLHAALWATRLCDITGNDTRSLDRPLPLQPRYSQAWHDWFRKRLHENVPYDQIVRGVLCATSREGRTPEAWMEHVRKIDEQLLWDHDSDYPDRETLDLYWRRREPVTSEQWGERTAAAFLGIRLECAQCHKHPFDRWTHADYRAYANLFGAVAVGKSPEAAKLIAAENAKRRENPGKFINEYHFVSELFLADEPTVLRHPETGQPLPAKALGGPEVPFEKGRDMRAALFEWMRSPENPYFARAFVNRVWAHYFGIGIVQPVDDFSLANPPSNEQLLDALATDFVGSKFDIRHVERVVLNSRTYQLSSKTNATNRLDKLDYAHSYLRPMMAEVVIDVLNSALDTRERWGQEARRGLQAVELGASALSPSKEDVMYALRRFGRPPRTTPCDCQRVTAPSLAQKLFLMTDPSLRMKLDDPTGRLAKLLKGELSDDEVIEELFLASVSRPPTAGERDAFREYRRKVPDRRAAFTDALWALINTREFILNH
jgi:Protein of unknown function (DUF1549)/Protein of unknown function (DUF1553)